MSEHLRASLASTASGTVQHCNPGTCTHKYPYGWLDHRCSFGRLWIRVMLRRDSCDCANDPELGVLSRCHNRAVAVCHSLARSSTAKQAPGGMGRMPIVAAMHGSCRKADWENLEESRDKVDVDCVRLWDGTVD